MQRDELIRYLEQLLDPKKESDYGPNGLQVEGRAEVKRVVTGVSACEELFERAVALEADAVLVHHGLFWDGTPQVLTGLQGRRVRRLLKNDLNLIAYHLPLDRHAEFGNNILAARAFGLSDIQPFALHRGAPIGFKGRFAEPVSSDRLRELCREIFAQDPLLLGRGPEPVRSLGIVSGGAQRELYSALADGLDAYLTGEASEWVTNIAREAGVHYLAAGHYATERLGVRRLGEHLAETFGLDVSFIDVPNPV